jgi:hypothetical protein
MSEKPKYIESLILKELGKRKGLVFTAGITGIGALVYSFLAEPHWLDVTRHKVKVPNLAPQWQGFTIAWLSDLHLIKNKTPAKGVREAFATVVAQKTDLAILGGDMFDRGSWFNEAGELFSLLPKSGIQTIAIMGNHEYHGNRVAPQRIVEGFEKIGIKVLLNDAMYLERGGVRHWIVGVDDYSRGFPEFNLAIRPLPDNTKPLLFLSHNPKMLNRIPENFCSLAISGHTHGGQINPALPPLHRRLNWVKWASGDMGSPFPLGWYNVNGNPLYVGRGLGTTRYPIRFNARPELPLFQLTA